MNYLLKLQTPAGFLEALPNNAMRCGKRPNICGHCLRKHGFTWLNAREISYTKVLELVNKKKALLNKVITKETVNNVESKQISKAEIKKIAKEVKKTSYKFAEYVNVTNEKSTRHKVKVQEIPPSEVKKFAEHPGMTFENMSPNPKFTLNSIHSYDPYLLSPVSSEDLLPRKSTAPEKLLNGDLKDTSVSSVQYSQKQHLNKRIKRKKDREVKNEDIDIDARKILPLNTVEIFPWPKHLKKSGDSVKASVSPDYKENKMFTMIPATKKHLSTLFEASLEKNSFDLEMLVPEANERYFHQEIPMKQVTKELTFIRLVHSYVDVCANNNMMDGALHLLKNLRKKENWQHVTGHENLVNVYNIFLEAYSKQGNLEAVNTVTELMKEDQVSFNPQSYAYLLDCLGQLPVKCEEERKKEVIKIFQHMDTKNISLDDLFTKTKLRKEKAERILTIIRTVFPHFEVMPRSLNLSSNCTLLESLHQNFSGLQSHIGNNLSLETLEKFVEEQLLLEKKFSIPIKGIWDFSKSRNHEQKFENLKSSWKKALLRGFQRKLKIAEIEHSKHPEKLSLYVYLKSLPPETFVAVMMRTVEDLLAFSGGFSPSLQILARNLGQDLFRFYEIKVSSEVGVVERSEKLFKKYCAWFLDPSGPARNGRQEWQMTIHDFNEGPLLDLKCAKWPDSVKLALGKYLYDIIFKEVRISVNSFRLRSFDKSVQSIPVFYSLLRYSQNATREEIKSHPVAAALFRKVGLKKLTFFADELPMVCPPKPWKNISHGGYLILPTDFVRLPQEDCGKFVNWKRIPEQQLYSVLDGLNALQAVPWMINENVLNVIIDVFRDGGSEELNVPKYPDAGPLPLEYAKDMSTDERKKEFFKWLNLSRQRKNDYSIWCETYYRLSLANHFRKRIFWLPQNIDFRGRVYPVPPHLNHLGSDLFRSLLLFAKGKPLGSKGLDWIKIHAINLTGSHKNRSVKERLDYANSVLPEILDSAERPLTGRKWWVKSEEPWQTLAACMEIKKALSCCRPEAFISHFPIHQDGSCNGLQHYAALGKDTVGAESVNLAPLDKPQDVYARVVEIVEQKRKEDAKNGVEIAQVLEGFVRRKVIKQTVMTTVYGVTLYGARLQIARQLKDIPDFPKEYVWPATQYLTQKTFDSLRQMFTSAKKIQDWFINCADIVTKGGEYIQWVSPLGLPVVQSYGNPNNVLSPNRKKQRNAFPPNFIHSLDSCHMMMTTLFCEQAGITFASIHDCFWTHPTSVEMMNAICREQFIALHSQPILEDLSRFFRSCYLQGKNEKLDKEALNIFRSVPEKGDFSLRNVLKSVYFFS